MKHYAVAAVGILALFCWTLPTIHGETLEGSDGIFSRVDFAPFYLETDVGTNDRERRSFASDYARIISKNLNFFLQAYSMKARDFEEFARMYGAEEGRFDPNVRIRLWRRYEPFLADLQKRYDTKAIAGAYKGRITPRDEYGEPDGPAFREVATYVEGQSEEAILQMVYHELGHLFMETFILYPTEVPSWIEEGTAQLFQYRKGNGTDPDGKRLERLAWAYEMVNHDHEFGKAIPWSDLITVRNMDNLDFTHQNPLRSTQQYIQVWLMSEFFIEDRRRARAYFQMLSALKASAKKRFEELVRGGTRGDRLWQQLRYHLYDVQGAIFTQTYGRDILDVEDLWHEWVSEEYERLLAKNPVLRYHRGTWHLDRRAPLAPTPEVRQQALAEAERIFQEAVDTLSEDPAGYVGLARIAMQRGDSEQASAHFAEATRLGSDFFEALVFGGKALINNGEAAEAIDGLEKALAERPSHWEATAFLGQALIISGHDIERGVKLIRSAYHQRQSELEIRLYEGVGHYLLGNYEDAGQVFADVFVAAGQKHVFAAAASAISRAPLMDDEDTERWLGLVQRLNEDLAKRLHQQLLQKKETIPLGFSQDGTPAIVGYTVDPTEAIIPTPQP